MDQFVGRQKELDLLHTFTQKRVASFLIIRGRRRIGKTRLIEEFARPYTFYALTGLPPDGATTAQSQRDEFMRQLSKQTGIPEVQADDWSKVFWLLAERLKKGRVILFFDEISWMGSEDTAFLGKIKHAWDTQFKQNPELIFVICGSASSWIEKNILSSTGFFGRISHTLTLEELPLNECNAFWEMYGKSDISAYEKFKVLSVTGGIPRYLEGLDRSEAAEKTIQRLCFKPGGLLVDEYDRIFSDLFLHESVVYRRIVECLAGGHKDARQISKQIKVHFSGVLTDYLRELKLAGFIKRDYTWHISTGEDSMLSRYRLSDNYLRFYMKYIAGRRTQIDRGAYEGKSLINLPGWLSMMGLQFENLVLNNRVFILNKLHLNLDELETENPFFQPKTTKQAGCQIDYMIQTRFRCLYLCEIKFSIHEINSSVITEVQEKINRLKRPRGFSCRPALIHINGVTQEVVDSQFFSDIIDFSEILA